MKILFLTYFYYDIYKPILAEMIRQGHNVTVIEDKFIPHDYFFKKEKFYSKYINKLLRHLLQSEKEYWDKTIQAHPEIDDYYDILVCQPGYSFCEYLLNKLKNKNSHIKSCVMIHDSSCYYDYFHQNDLYDRVYTFDYEDAKKYKKVEVLGAYWVPTKKVAVKYDLAMIGSDHDDRYDIINKIYPQLDNTDLNCFVKIVSIPPAKVKSLKKKIISIIHNRPNELKVWSYKIKQPFVTDKPYPVEEVQDIINSSNCILETDRDGQSGLTLRDMWALASGKKIITTNTYLKSLPFYSEDQIMFIDRTNPVVNINFIKEKIEFHVSEAIIEQRIDNWVKRLISFT